MFDTVVWLMEIAMFSIFCAVALLVGIISAVKLWHQRGNKLDDHNSFGVDVLAAAFGAGWGGWMAWMIFKIIIRGP